MRILALVSSPGSAADAVRLAQEIGTFNAGIDFRLRFLHIEMELSVVATPDAAAKLREAAPKTPLVEFTETDSNRASAALALLMATERPDLVLLIGAGPLALPARAASGVAGPRLAVFGTGRAAEEGELDLGAAPPQALDKLTGVAREIG